MVAPISEVLTVDDDPIFQEQIKASFEGRGLTQIHQAGDEAEAIAILNAEPNIDLIVTDLLMPETDGSDLMGHLKKRGEPNSSNRCQFRARTNHFRCRGTRGVI